MDKIKANAKHICAIISAVVAVVIGLLDIFGVQVSVNEVNLSNLIFAVSFIISAVIELWPIIKDLIKNKNLAKILNVIKTVVDSVEELKDLSGSQKKNVAVDAASTALIKQGINIDTNTISDLIEDAVALRNNIVK